MSEEAKKDEGGTLVSLMRNKEAPFAERLRVLCGYVENGTDGSVGVFQDDATRTWVVVVDKNKRYYGTSMNEAFEEAFQDPKNDPEA